MIQTYKEILSKNIKQEIDTDTGILRAIWKTCKELIAQGDKRECLQFYQYVYTYWGEFKAKEMRGDMVDAGILQANTVK